LRCVAAILVAAWPNSCKPNYVIVSSDYVVGALRDRRPFKDALPVLAPITPIEPIEQLVVEHAAVRELPGRNMHTGHRFGISRYRQPHSDRHHPPLNTRVFFGEDPSL
jgi:hypothetical protein